MRFITEFELHIGESKDYVSFREFRSAQYLGVDISKAFGWQSRGETTFHGPVTERHTLEIEAFPMDKWIEFKDDLLYELRQPHADRDKIEELINKLESFGKPALK